MKTYYVIQRFEFGQWHDASDAIEDMYDAKGRMHDIRSDIERRVVKRTVTEEVIDAIAAES